MIILCACAKDKIYKALCMVCQNPSGLIHPIRERLFRDLREPCVCHKIVLKVGEGLESERLEVHCPTCNHVDTIQGCDHVIGKVTQPFEVTEEFQMSEAKQLAKDGYLKRLVEEERVYGRNTFIRHAHCYKCGSAIDWELIKEFLL